jgi:hypothetical protein
MEFVARTGKTSEPHAFEAVMDLQMGEAHLDAFALVTRPEKGLRLHQSARHIAGILVNIAWDFPCELPGATARLEWTGVAIKLA